CTSSIELVLPSQFPFGCTVGGSFPPIWHLSHSRQAAHRHAIFNLICCSLFTFTAFSCSSTLASPADCLLYSILPANLTVSIPYFACYHRRRLHATLARFVAPMLTNYQHFAVCCQAQRCI